jgi:hypothetical protein
MAQNFAATVGAWVDDYKDAAETIFRASAQEVLNDANLSRASGGSRPIDTGFLGGSLTVGINEEPANVNGLRSSGSYALEILPAKLGDVLMARWTAAYARRMEYGFNGQDSLGRTYRQQGFGFVRKAAQNWVSIVAKYEAAGKRVLGVD